MDLSVTQWSPSKRTRKTKRTRKNDRPRPSGPIISRKSGGPCPPKMLEASAPAALESELRFERQSDRARLIGRDARDRRLLPREDRIVDGQSGMFVGQIGAEQGRRPDLLAQSHPEVHQAV